MNHVIIVAAGNSTRMGGMNKVLADVGGKPVLAHTLEAFEQCTDIDSITIVTQEQFFNDIGAMQKKYSIKKIKNIVEGGKERQDSVFNGVVSLNNMKEDDIVVVHNEIGRASC